MKNKKINLLIRCILIFSLVLSLIGCSSEKSESDFKNEAQYLVQEKVKSNLKSPSSAKFPTWDDSFVKKIGDNEYFVESYVDAKNGFGSTVRSNYSAKVIFLNNDEYTIEDLIIK